MKLIFIRLKKKIARGPLKLEEAIELAVQIAQGLEKAHGQKITHRDIKPANVMVTDDGVAKIVDFGLAKLAGRTKLTKEGATLGTVAYMSPEQAQGEKIDHRSDIWSLGVVLYKMLTGLLPFDAEYEQAVIYSIVQEDPEPITALRTGVPMELERVVDKCLAKKPAERYQHAGDVLVDLQKVKKEIVSSTDSFVSQAKSKKSAFIPRIALAGVAVVVLTFLAAQFGGLFKPKDNVPRLSNPKQVTSALGVEEYPTWSPAGDRLAYQSGQSGNSDIWVSQIGGDALAVYGKQLFFAWQEWQGDIWVMDVEKK